MFRGFKQPIPKHINDEAKAARVARPDFYVGPTTVSKKSLSAGGGDGDPDMNERMTRIRDGALRNAQERSEAASKRRAGLRFSILTKALRRLQLRRPARRVSPNSSA
jgi:hypothetical protein